MAASRISAQVVAAAVRTAAAVGTRAVGAGVTRLPTCGLTAASSRDSSSGV
ncbi:hypothetical protein [Streptomyces sp. SA15]|uniref:hypothetical protein n=1 Tax=Streptomyces sp. SA15 TaxID=934019 RepID=UPI0015C8BF17|nr:hypothetical protein [Streptomyces sp. SA15]